MKKSQQVFPLFIAWLVQITSVDAKMCVAIEQDRFVCTDDASKANAYRSKNPSDNFSFDDLGVGT